MAPRNKETIHNWLLKLTVHYMMANKYSNVIFFYYLANKLIGVTEKVKNVMINYNL